MAETKERFRVKAISKDWGDPGPDLLRFKRNARDQLRSLLGERGAGWWCSRERDENIWAEWKGPLTKQELLAVFDKWNPTSDMRRFRVGRRDDVISLKFIVRMERILIKDIANVVPSVELNSALVDHQFPGIIHSGDFVCKRYNGSNDPRVGWSDHAHGDAYDRTHDPSRGVHNDDVFDWQRRMAISGNMKLAYVIGSQNGREVKTSAPDWDIRNYDETPTSGSHLWHNHGSVDDNEGAKPACAA